MTGEGVIRIWNSKTERMDVFVLKDGEVIDKWSEEDD